jgi:hypothetical protein
MGRNLNLVPSELNFEVLLLHERARFIYYESQMFHCVVFREEIQTLAVGVNLRVLLPDT